MKYFMKAATVIFIFAFLVASCSSTENQKHTKPDVEQPKAETLTTDQFIELYVELSIIAERNLADSVTLKEKQEQVFAERGITRDEFYEFEGKISSEPEKWADIWNKIVDKVEHRMAEEGVNDDKEPPALPERDEPESE